MIRINLLPIRQIKQRNQARQQVVTLIAAFFAVLGLIALVGLQQEAHIAQLKDEINRLNQEKTRYQALVAQIEKIKKDQAVIERKLAVIKGLKGSSQLPARVLDEIATLTPEDRIWLTSVDYNASTVNLAGTALDNATVADYLNKIGKSDFFMTPELKDSKLAMVANQKLKSFSLSVNVQAPPAPPPPPPAPGAKK